MKCMFAVVALMAAMEIPRLLNRRRPPRVERESGEASFGIRGTPVWTISTWGYYLNIFVNSFILQDNPSRTRGV